MKAGVVANLRLSDPKQNLTVVNSHGQLPTEKRLRFRPVFFI